MKNIILVAAISMCLIACTSTNKNHEENIKLVESYVKAVENMDFDAMGNYLADDYLGVGPSFGDSINKDDAVLNWQWNVTNLYEKIHYNRSRFASVTIPDGENKGDWVANWAELTIDYQYGIGSVTILANTNYFIENGKISKSLTFYNEADALRQLAYEMVPPEEWE